MRPGQNKRLRGRPGRKGPNPLTRSFESNGPDVKIRGTAQHVAEKYLQLARDAQSSGDIVLAENLLQHAEHYFRLIAAAQQQQGGYGRPSYDQEAELEEEDDFTGAPDRFAPLAERLPSPAYSAQQPNFQPPANYVAAGAPQPSFQPPQAQPQPFEERPAYPEMRHERPVRSDRVQFGGRNRDRGQEQNAEGGERPERGERQPRFGFDRNRERPRFEPRRDRDASFGAEPQGALEGGAGLPAFITAPPAASRGGEGADSDAGEERAGGRGGFTMSQRRRSRAPREDAAEEQKARGAGEELPLPE